MNDALRLPTATAAATWREVRGLLSADRLLAALAVVALLVGTAAGLAVPPLLGAVVDVVVGGGAVARIDVLALLLLLATATSALFTGWGTVLVARLGERALAGLRERVVARALDVPQHRLEQAGSGDLVARVGGDQEAVSDAVREVLPTLVLSVLTIALTAVGLGLLDPWLALAGAAAVPVQVLVTRWYLRGSSPLYAAERVALGVRTQVLGDALRGRRTVAALRQEAAQIRRFRDVDGHAVEAGLRAARTASWFGAGLNGAELIGLGTVLAVGWVLVDRDALTVGAATAAALYFHQLFNPIMELLFVLDPVQDAGAALTRLVGVAALPAAAPVAPSAGRGAVRGRGLRFAFVPGRDVLADVDLDLPAGSRVAVVGRTGAGKSTLAGVLAGVHAPDAGTVTVDDAVHDPAALHATVALVTQEVHVFSGTLADDLRLARPDATDAELSAALDAVGASWVHALPDGPATRVGEDGHRLDPVQAQQLALARLHLHPATVVVLDEATAEAGSAGARLLDRAAEVAVRGRTALVVAHRLSQAATADRVVVLDDGRVVEAGTHRELVAAGGRYAGLWTAWASARPAPVTAGTGVDE